MARAQALKQERARQTRSRLLVVAARLFAERGYEHTAVDDVGEDAGVSKGAFYFHFASKEAVLLALIDDWADASKQRMQDARRGLRAPDAGVRALLQALLAEEGAGVPSAALLLEFWSQRERSARVRRRLKAVYATWRRALVRAYVAGGRDDSEAARSAELALAVHYGLVVGALLGAPRPRDAVEVLTTIVAPGARREGRGRAAGRALA